MIEKLLIKATAQKEVPISPNVTGDVVIPNHSGDHKANVIQCSGFRLTTGAGAGKVLTSDANGNATWV